jgi:hypothetical protein
VSPIEACRRCGRLVPYMPRGICRDCLEEREKQFSVVREWLRENPGASISQASEATGIDEPVIAGFINEGRLQFVASVRASAEAREHEVRRARIAAEVAAELARRGPEPPRYSGMRIRS